MTIKADVNLGSLIPILALLLVQSGGGIWWASSISTNVENLGETVERQATDQKEDTREIRTRVSSNEVALAAVATNAQTFAAEVASLRGAIGVVRSDIRANNDLLREILSSGALTAERN